MDGLTDGQANGTVRCGEQGRGVRRCSGGANKSCTRARRTSLTPSQMSNVELHNSSQRRRRRRQQKQQVERSSSGSGSSAQRLSSAARRGSAVGVAAVCGVPYLCFVRVASPLSLSVSLSVSMFVSLCVCVLLLFHRFCVLFTNKKQVRKKIY